MDPSQILAVTKIIQQQQDRAKGKGQNVWCPPPPAPPCTTSYSSCVSKCANAIRNSVTAMAATVGGAIAGDAASRMATGSAGKTIVSIGARGISIAGASVADWCLASCWANKCFYD